MMLRRRALRLLAAGMATSAWGCAGLRHDLTPGSLKDGSRIHAFQAASFSHAFTSSHARQWHATLTKMTEHGLALLRALPATGYRMDVAVRMRPVKSGDGGAYVDVDLAFASDPDAAVVELHGRAETDPAKYAADVERAAQAVGLDAQLLEQGHFAIYGAAAMLVPLNVSGTALKKHAFGLLALREKIEAGEQADYLSPTRPAEETLEDIEVALRVIAAHHALTAAWRAEVLGILAMAEAAESDVAMTALEEQLAEGRERVANWDAEHPRPTMEQFGVAMNELTLPTPEGLLKKLDEDGYLTAAIKVAKGIATGDPRATVQGFAELAPEDSSVRIVLEGAVAASNGDIGTTITSIAKLVDAAEPVAAIEQRLRRVEGAVSDMKGGVDAIGAAIAEPSSLGGL